MHRSACRPGVLLTGPPGIGKSTACQRIAELCKAKGIRVEGFVTEELRERGRRVGFDLVGLGSAAGARATLARVGDGTVKPGVPMVGRYEVALKDFEDFALPILDEIETASKESNALVCIVDEIGKMELFSDRFVSRVRDLLRTRPMPLLFTVALQGKGLINEAKRAPGFDLVELSEANRDVVPRDAFDRLLGLVAGGVKGASRNSKGYPAQVEAPAARSSDGPKARRWVARLAPDSPQTGVNKDVGGGGSASSAEHFQAEGRVVVWLRNELRVADNPLLTKAVDMCRESNVPCVPVLCLDPRHYDEKVKTAFGHPKVGPLRRQFLEESVAELEARFKECGVRLFVCDASPESALPLFAGKCGRAIAVSEACPEEVADEQRVGAAMRLAGAKLELQDAEGISTLFGADALKDLGIGTGADFPEDFQAFYRPVKDRIPRLSVQMSSSYESFRAAVSKLPKLDEEDVLKAAADAGVCVRSPTNANAESNDDRAMRISGGENAATARLYEWLKSGGATTYKDTFRHLVGDCYSSRLSPYLALGCISVQRVATEVAASTKPSRHLEHFLYELCWRDFFRHAARRWKSNLFKLRGPLGVERSWRRDAEVETRWKHGKTGVPLIDAAMCELKATGYMGNLARQFTAAFLVDDLGLDWRVGADWFESNLLDYDPHSNWGQWARTAGVTFTTDSKRKRVGGTQYFDLALDIDGGQADRYIRTWLPHLAAAPSRVICAPWLSPDLAELADYPKEPLCSPELRRYFESRTNTLSA